MKLALAAALASALVAAAPAAAVTYAYSFVTATDAASGRLMTVSTGTSAITNITGTFDGSSVTGLSSYASADNTYSPADPHVTYGGLSVSTASGVDYNVFYDGTMYRITDSASDPGGFGSNAPGVTAFTVSQVPEPATWGLLIVGFGMTGIAARRRSVAITA